MKFDTPTLSILMGLLLVIGGISLQFTAMSTLSITGTIYPPYVIIPTSSSQVFSLNLGGYETGAECTWKVNNVVINPYQYPYSKPSNYELQISGGIGVGTYYVTCDFVLFYGAEVGSAGPSVLFVQSATQPTPTPTPTPSATPIPTPTATPPQQVVLTLGSAGMGDVNPSVGDHTYNVNTQVQISAMPSLSGWQFDHWLFDDFTENESPVVTLTMSRSRTALAIFTEIVYPTPTPTSSSSPTPTPTPTPSYTPIPTSTVSPTPTPTPFNGGGDTELLRNTSYVMILAGIGMVLFGFGRKYGGKRA
jgi:hypothetical protein